MTEDEREEYLNKIKHLEDKQAKIMLIEKKQSIIFRNTINSIQDKLLEKLIKIRKCSTSITNLHLTSITILNF